MIRIIIPTYNAAKQLDELLSMLFSQTEKDFEIAVIDSSSVDDTISKAKSYHCKTISICKSDFDHGTTRNQAANNLNSAFIVFLTQDAVPVDEYMLEELIKPMQANPNIAVCYGRQIPNKDAGLLEQFAREFNYPPCSVLKKKEDIPAMGLKTFFCSNCCSAIRRSTFQELGGFKNNAIVNEDMLFAAKAIMAGYSVYYNAEAKVYHSHRYSLFRLFGRYFQIGRFFADNRWVLAHTGLNGYGLNIAKVGTKHFWRNRRPHLVLVLFIELALKAIACKLGWYYQLMYNKRRNEYE